MKKLSAFQADLLLLVVTIIWGSTFVMVKSELAFVPPMTFVAWRFLMAAGLLTAVFKKRIQTHLDRSHWIGATVIGLFLGGGFIVQTIGIQTTPSGKAGFLTGINVVLIPVFAFFLFRKLPSLLTGLGVGLATVGLGLLSLKGDLSLAPGDLWILGCAVAFAFQIIYTGFFMEESRGLDAIALAVIQVYVAAILTSTSALVFEGLVLDIPLRSWLAIAFLAVFATSFAFCVQTAVQRFTSATHVGLIFSMEPVFAGIFGWAILDEVMSGKELWGCGLILLGMLLAELRWKFGRGSFGRAAAFLGKIRPSRSI